MRADLNMDEVKARLLQRQRQVLERINADALAEVEDPEATEGPRELQDQGDNATYEVAEGERLSDAARATEKLFQIEEALRRVDEGTYGVCVDCEEDIDERRLNAVPEAERCIACQEIYNRDHIEGRRHATM